MTLQYLLKIEEEHAARNAYNHAGVALELAAIRKRLAECESQHAPLCALRSSLRAEAYAVAFYCVVGRWPEGFAYLGERP